MSKTFENKLQKRFQDKPDLLQLLLRAEDLAQNRGIIAKRRGNEGYETIKAALELAIAVWEVEARRRLAGNS